MNEMARSRWTRDGYAHGCRDYDLPGTWLAVITRVVCLPALPAPRRPPSSWRGPASVDRPARFGPKRGGNPDQTDRADWADTYMSRRVRSTRITRITPSLRSRSPPARGRARSYAAQDASVSQGSRSKYRAG